MPETPDQRTIKRLVAERDAALERVRQLEVLVKADPADVGDYVGAFGLTRRQAIVLNVLMRRDRVSHAQLEAAAWDRQPDAPHATSVAVSRLRGRLKDFGVVIYTAWGSGYYLSPAMKVQVVELVATWRRGGGAPVRPVSGPLQRPNFLPRVDQE